MESVLLVIHLIVAVAIIAVVLLQPSEAGGFMGNSGSMSNLMMQRRSGDVLTRLTTILAGVFFMTSLLLAILAGGHGKTAQTSILDVPVPAAEMPVVPSMPDMPPPPAAPVAPEAPAVPTAPISQ